MQGPYANFIQWTWDTGFQPVPQVSTRLPGIAADGTIADVYGLVFNNPSGVDIQLTLIDSASGLSFVGPVVIPANGIPWVPPFVPGMPIAGIRWVTDLVGLIGKAWGHL